MKWVGKVTLVNPVYDTSNALYVMPQLGLGVVARKLAQCACVTGVHCVDQALEFAEGKLSPSPDIAQICANQLAENNADIYGFSVQCFNLPVAVATARHLKQLRPSAKIVFGGHHARLLGKKLQSLFTFLDEVTSGDDEPHLGLGRTASLETPDFSMFPNLRRYCAVSSQPTGLVEVSRGCPFTCEFCSIPSAFGPRIVHKAVSDVVDEMHFWAANGIHDLHLVDDILTLDRKYVYELLREIAQRRVDVEWTGMTRADLVDLELLRELRSAGCTGLLYGVDSADPNTLILMNKKARRYPRLTELAAWHLAAGIRPTFYFLVDYPSETRESIERTLRCAAQISVIDPGSCRINLPRLVPGTGVTARSPLSLVLDLEAPYADVLRATTGGTSGEIWELINAFPELFSTYYSISGGQLSRRTVHAIGRFATRLLQRYPLSMTAVSETDSLLNVFEHLPDQTEGSVENRLEQVFTTMRDGPEEFFLFERWRAAPSRSPVLLSRVDLTSVVSAVAEEPSNILTTLTRQARLYQISASK